MIHIIVEEIGNPDASFSDSFYFIIVEMIVWS